MHNVVSFRGVGYSIDTKGKALSRFVSNLWRFGANMMICLFTLARCAVLQGLFASHEVFILIFQRPVVETCRASSRVVNRIHNYNDRMGVSSDNSIVLLRYFFFF